MRIIINDEVLVPPYILMKSIAVSLGIFTLFNLFTMVEEAVEYFMRKC